MTTSVAIVASEGFSTFHFSVPLILFGDSVSDCPRFSRYKPDAAGNQPALY